MSTDELPKGKAFEAQVRDILFKLRDKHPEYVRIIEQPRLDLHDGQVVIPDFDLQFDLLLEEGRYLIERQDRKRSIPQILQKIKYMKGLSSRNRFIFVYAKTLAETTRNALDSDGVIHMSLEELAAFVARLELQLSSQGDPKKIKDEDFDSDLLRHFPFGTGPTKFKLPVS